MMMTPRPIPWWAPQLTGLEEALIRDVLASNYLNEGEVTERFEESVASHLGTRYAVATTSGTAALFLALAALDVGPGDEVIVPDVTFIASANAVKLTGATVVLADVDSATMTLDPASVLDVISPLTKAIMPVHVSGRSADMRALASIAMEYGLHLVEDAAEAFGSSIGGLYLGCHGTAGCFSFSPNKTISTGQGGMVVTNDDRLYKRLRELKDQGRPVRGTGGDDIHGAIGFNFKMTNLQAAVGLGQLSVLEQRLARQQQINARYRQRLENIDGISVLPFQLGDGEVPQWSDALVVRRDDLDQYLSRRGIQCRRYWHPLHTQLPYRSCGDSENFPVSHRLSKHALWLPSAFSLTDEDIDIVCDEILACLEK